MSTRFDCTDEAARAEGIAAARDAIAAKACVVLPTDTVYGIAADAFSPQAVATLLAAKGRGRTMPPPVLIASPATLDGLATDVPAAARALAERFWPGALTLILNAQPSLTWDLGETRGTVALRVPDDALARDLLRETGPLAVSSANRSGQPAAATADAAEAQLAGSVAVYLDGGPRGGGQDGAPPSTIVDFTSEPPRVVRQGAVALGELRAVVPGVLDADGRGPGADGPADGPGADADARGPEAGAALPEPGRGGEGDAAPR